jgi:hypothetical protein
MNIDFNFSVIDILDYTTEDNTVEPYIDTDGYFANSIDELITNVYAGNLKRLHSFGSLNQALYRYVDGYSQHEWKFFLPITKVTFKDKFYENKRRV